ncbi:hypothetical protein D9981_06720 [Pseudoalteromonas phenolica O-BC30]|nr:hypothetical protein D9981_06720 [Pseudoalteromonas phenolica O-BC30]
MIKKDDFLEVQTLHQQFYQLTKKLTFSFTKLEMANTENQQLNERLTEFNLKLEQQVDEKTKKTHRSSC